MFLTVIGAKQYTALRDLCMPQNMKDLSYEDLCKLMTEHHEQAPPMHLQRTKFEARSRLPNETIPEFVSALRDLSKHCQFGASLEERLCERIVRGLNNQKVQRTLLRESSLELKKAISIAQAAEITDFGSKELCESKEGRKFNYVNKSKVNTPSKVGGKFNNHQSRQQGRPEHQALCYRCGNNHPGKQCRFINTVCSACNKTGHLHRVCKTTSQPQSAKPHSSSKGNKKPQRNFKKFLKKEGEEETCHLYSLKTENQAIWADLEVDGKKMKFQVDTGASHSVITV